MDLRVLVLTADHALGDLVRTQVENLGGRCNVIDSYDDLGTVLGWADAAVVDLAGGGLDDLSRLRVEAPRMRVLAIAPDAAMVAAADHAGVDAVVEEPFSVADIVDAVRNMGRPDVVVDLRTGEPIPVPVVDDAPWWATR